MNRIIDHLNGQLHKPMPEHLKDVRDLARAMEEETRRGLSLLALVALLGVVVVACMAVAMLGGGR